MAEAIAESLRPVLVAALAATTGVLAAVDGTPCFWVRQVCTHLFLFMYECIPAAASPPRNLTTDEAWAAICIADPVRAISHAVAMNEVLMQAAQDITWVGDVKTHVILLQSKWNVDSSTWGAFSELDVPPSQWAATVGVLGKVFYSVGVGSYQVTCECATSSCSCIARCATMMLYQHVVGGACFIFIVLLSTWMLTCAYLVRHPGASLAVLGPQLGNEQHKLYYVWLDLIPCAMHSKFLSLAKPVDTERRLDVFGPGAQDHANQAMVAFLKLGAETGLVPHLMTGYGVTSLSQAGMALDQARDVLPSTDVAGIVGAIRVRSCARPAALFCRLLVANTCPSTMRVSCWWQFKVSRTCSWIHSMHHLTHKTRSAQDKAQQIVALALVALTRSTDISQLPRFPTAIADRLQTETLATRAAGSILFAGFPSTIVLEQLQQRMYEFRKDPCKDSALLEEIIALL